MNKTRSLLIAAVLSMFTGTPATAASVGGVFSQGSAHLSVVGGSGYAFNESYLVIGAGINYYLVDGLSVGLHAEAWTGGDPGIYKITPSVQYVFYQVPHVSPYVGAFYTRTFIDHLPDLDSAGGRAGVYFAVGRSAYIGVGAVYENYLDCNKSTYRDCSEIYPEVSISFAF
jgi:hypothetical protein